MPVIRSRVTILLVTVLAILPLAIVWFAFVTSSSTLGAVQTKFARDIYRSTSADLADLTAEYVVPISSTAERSAAQLGAGILSEADPDAAGAYLWTTIEHEPRITAIAWYQSDGVIHEVERNANGVVSSSYDPNAEEPSVATAWRTTSGAVVSQTVTAGTLKVTDPLLLVRSQLEGSAVSDPTSTDDGKIQEVTFAVTAQGPVGGTIFVQTDLAELGRFIALHAPSASSRVFIVSDGDLVAHSRPELINQAPAGTSAALLADAATIAASNLAVGGDGWQLLSVNDEPFHAVSHQIDGIHGLAWTVITVGPEDDFDSRFTPLRAADTRKLAAIALLSIVLAIPLVRVAARDVGSLQTAAHRDSLTGLVNRRTFEKHGATLIAAARRRRRSVGALMVDIDHFKQLNDTYGHHAGDEVLEAVAGRISHSVAKTDLVARLGGDEIALLLEGADLAASQSIAARLRNAVTASPISTNRGPIYVTVSIGASATGGADRARLEDVLKAADRALYASKRAGRDRITAVQVARSH